MRLPVSGTTVVLRLPSGADDVFLSEQSGRGTDVATAFLSRIATRTDGSPIDWEAMSITDVDVALLEVRRMVIGDFLRTAVRCTSPECGALFDISFRVSDYLKHHLPRRARASASDEPGWFRLDRTDVLFRLPTASDVIAVADAADVESALAERCIRPSGNKATQRRVETAMQALAPSLYDELDCICHECEAAVPIVFNPTSFVLDELARRAAYIYDDVHALAAAYHWSERDILALPQPRRMRYAELARGDR